jgi:hypothetical protein
MVRVVNLARGSVDVAFKAVSLWGPLPTGQVPTLAAVPAGKATLAFKSDSAGTTSVSLDSQSECCTTVFLLPDGKTTVEFPPCPIKPTAQGNLHVFFLEGGSISKTATVSIKGPDGASVVLKADEPFKNVETGTYTFDGTDLTVSPAVAYTLVFIGANGKFKPMLMQDTDTRKPVAGKAASA